MRYIILACSLLFLFSCAPEYCADGPTHSVRIDRINHGYPPVTCSYTVGAWKECPHSSVEELMTRGEQICTDIVAGASACLTFEHFVRDNNGRGRQNDRSREKIVQGTCRFFWPKEEDE